MENPKWKTNGTWNNYGNVLTRELLSSQAINKVSWKRVKNIRRKHWKRKRGDEKINRRTISIKHRTTTWIINIKFEHKLGLIHDSLVSVLILNVDLIVN